jgi:hypothetical protein
MAARKMKGGQISTNLFMKSFIFFKFLDISATLMFLGLIAA